MSDLFSKIRDVYQVAKQSLKDCFADDYDETGMKSLSVEKLNRLISETSFSTLLNYEFYDPEDEIYYNKNSLSIAMEVMPLCGIDLEAYGALSSFVNEKLPEETIMHMLMLSTNEVDGFLDRFEQERSQRGGIYCDLAKKRVDYFKSKNNESILSSEKFVLKNFKLFIDITVDERVEKSELIHIKNTLGSVLDGMGAKHKKLEPKGLAALVASILTPKKSLEQINPLDPISLQCCESGTSVKIGKSSIMINEGERMIRSCSIKEYPMHWHPFSMGDMVGDPFKATQRLGFPFGIATSIYIPKQDLLLAKYAAKRTNTQNSVRGLGRYSRKAQDTAKDLGFMMKLTEEGQRLVKLSCDFLVLGDQHHIDAQYIALTSVLDAKKWRYAESKYTQVHALLRCLPMGVTPDSAKAMERFAVFKTLTTKTALNFLPMQAEAKGSETPVMILAGRRGQIVFWNPFGKGQGNYNTIIAAPSGAGKSATAQEYINGFTGAGGRAWIIDVGRSYYKLTKILGGDFIEFSSKNKISLNPFSDIVNIRDEDEKYMNFIKPLVGQMASPHEPLSQVQMAAIEEALFNVWDDKGPDMTITDLACYLLSSRDMRAADLGKMLYPYTKQGMYGRYFEGQSTFKHNSHLMTLELEDLKNSEDLKSVVLMLLMFKVTDAMYLGDRSVRKTCLIDEAWDMMKNIQGAKFIETGFRRARKYNGNFVICTQSIEDCFDNKATTEAYHNSEWTIILRHKEAALKKIVESGRLPLTDYEYKLARSLETRSGEFSEALIKSPRGSFLGRLILDPYSMELFSTQAQDVVQLNKLVDGGMSMQMALDAMVQSKRI